MTTTTTTNTRRATSQDIRSAYSDMHKDAYGVRPREDLSDWTESEFELAFATMERVIAQNEAEEAERQRKAIERFEARVTALIASGASDRATAIRWLHEASSTNGDDDFLCYDQGLPYGYFDAVVMIAPAGSALDFYTKDGVAVAQELLANKAYGWKKVEKVYAKGEDAAEEMFDLSNNPDRADERATRWRHSRSLSVGDIVLVTGEMYLCQSTGWEKLPRAI